MTPKTVALLGSANIGRTNLLRIFIRSVEEGNTPGKILKADFSGEATIAPGGRETKTIHPNKITYKDDTGQNYTILAPGGETDRPVIKMGNITSSRLARGIVAVFDLTQDLPPQLDFFNKTKIFVKVLWVIFTKFDLLQPGEQEDRQSLYEDQVKAFFSQRGIQVRGIGYAGDSADPSAEDENEKVVDLLLEAARSA